MKKQIFTVLSATLSYLGLAQSSPSSFWSTIQSPQYSVTAGGTRYLDAVNANVVWCTGYDGTAPGLAYNFFARTIDGGNTWNNGNVFADTNTYIISNIEGVNDTVAWVSAYMKQTQDRGVLYYTMDGGMTWQQGSDSTMFQYSTSFADFVCFLTPNVGVAMGDPASGYFEIYRTTNGGVNWTRIPSSNIPAPISGEYGLTNSYTKVQGNDSCIWFGTNKRRVYRSFNSGQTWSVSTISSAPSSMYVNDLAFTDPMNGLVMGSTVSGTVVTYYLFKTNDGGATWTQITPLDPNLGHNDLCAIPGTTWFASCGAGTGNQVISYSTDKGTTWNSWGGSNVQYLSIDFVNPNTGWAGGFEDQVQTDGGIYKYSGPALGLNTISFIPKNLDVYPNPSNGEVNIKLPISKKSIQIQVLNTLGQIIYQQSVNNPVKVNDYKLNIDAPAGVYVMKMITDYEVYSTKITIQ